MSAIPLSQILSGPGSDSDLNQQQPIPLSQLTRPTQQNHSLLPIKNPYMLGSEPLGGSSLAGVPTSIASTLGGLVRDSQLQMADLIDTQDWHKRNAENASREEQQRQEALANAQGLAQKNNAAVIDQHPVLGNLANYASGISNALGQGAAAIHSLVNPTAGHAEQQGLGVTTPVVPNASGTVGGIVGGALPLVGTSLIPGAGIPLSAALMAAQGAGQTRADIAGLREQGQNVSGGQEALTATLQGGVQAALAPILASIGSLAPGLKSALASGDESVIRSLLGKSLQGAALNTVVGTVSNALKQTYDPNTPITQGSLENIVTGALLPHLLNTEVTDQSRTPEQVEAAKAAIARRKGMIQLPGGVPEESENAAANQNPEIANAPILPASESAVNKIADQQIPLSELQAEHAQQQSAEQAMAKPAVPNVQPMPPESVEAKAARDQALLEQQKAFEQQQNARQLATTNPRTQPATPDTLSNMADRDVALNELQQERDHTNSVNEAVAKPPAPGLGEQADKGAQFENKVAAANQNFAEKSAEPLPSKPVGVLADMAKSANTLKTIGGKAKDALAGLFPVEAHGLFKLSGKENETLADTANALRTGMNSAMNEHEGAMASLANADKAFGQLSPDLQKDFQARMYDDMPQATPELREVAEKMFAITRQRKQQIADLGVDAAKDFEDRHWNMLWKQDPDQAARISDRIYGSGKLGGRAAGTLKARTEGDFQSKLDAGLVPTFDNPMQQFAATDEAQRRFIGMGRAVKSLADDGTLIRTAKLPAGFVDVTGVLPKSFQEIVKGDGEVIAAPKAVADLIRNVATPSLFQGGSIRRGVLNTLRATNNFLTQIALGVSGFHLKKVFGLEQLPLQIAEGSGIHPGEGLLGLRSARNGEAIQEQMMGLRPVLDPTHAKIIDALTGAMTAQHDKFYDNRIATNFREAWKNKSPWEGLKSLVKAPLVGSQNLTQDVIFKSVQRAKLSFAFDALNKFIDNNPDASTRQIQREASKISNHVDNILGLLNRDNLLWDRTMRDIGSLSTLSVGWNYGTIRSLGHAATEIAQGAHRAATEGVSKPDLSNYRSTKYWVASALAAGLYGTLKSYYNTSKAPQNLTDTLFPKTGEKDDKGRDVRENPGFYSNDIYDYLTHPLNTISGKGSPVLHLAADLLTNRDYKGDQIRNPDDAAGEQLKQLGGYMLKQHLTPITVTNILNRYQRANTPEDRISAIVDSLFSRTAPVSISESPMDKLLQQIRSESSGGSMTPEQQAHVADENQYVKEFQSHRQGDAWDGEQYKVAKDMADSGQYSPEAIERVARRAVLPQQQAVAYDSSLSPQQLSQLWDSASPDEKKDLLPGISWRASHVHASKVSRDEADAWRSLVKQAGLVK
jgi:hypothetical protein